MARVVPHGDPDVPGLLARDARTEEDYAELLGLSIDCENEVEQLRRMGRQHSTDPAEARHYRSTVAEMRAYQAAVAQVAQRMGYDVEAVA